ncbi:sensor histidine kinase [Marinoscillum sp.]|uniref:sensor histidine kinase n=1 Tax=Marinoscillum sp. TaxID=2024838 RepID=UPI003BA9270B
MKLLSNYYKIYLLLTVPLFILVAIGYYFLLVKIITSKADELLLEDKSYIISQLQGSEQLMDVIVDLSDDYALRRSMSKETVANQFSTLMIYDELEDEEEPYRQLFCTISLNEQTYELTIRKSMVEYNSIMYSIFGLGIVFSSLLILGFTLINRFLTRTVWSPFYKTIRTLSNYSVESKKGLQLEESTIQEFQLLNHTVMKMSDKIRNDFLQQKKFIDHVAHEVQTPLSIVNANIENILQNKHLTQEDYLSIQNISESSIKLSRIVKSLLLLSRIENNQFDYVQSVDLVGYFVGYMDRNKEHLDNKNISFINECKEAFHVTINPALVEILVSNLGQNAIRHNIDSGYIKLTKATSESGEQLVIANTGFNKYIDPDKMFNMFQKHSKNPESMGIGLSVVKEICEAFNITVSYTLIDDEHRLTIKNG